MPIYEYLCQSCGKKFETLQKFSDEPLTVHPECGGGPVERLISTSALQFKGSGWYVNDYAKGGSSVKTGEPKSETKSDTAKSESGSKSEGSTSKTESSSSSTSAPASTSSTPAPSAPASSK